MKISPTVVELTVENDVDGLETLEREGCYRCSVENQTDANTVKCLWCPSGSQLRIHV